MDRQPPNLHRLLVAYQAGTRVRTGTRPTATLVATTHLTEMALGFTCQDL
jgi:hypothetical protein